MKKRRLLFFVTNSVAILAVLASVFLPWWQGSRPYDVALTEILPWGFIDSFGFSPSVVVAIFIGAAVMLLGALLALKLVVLGGVLVNAVTVALWFLAFHIGWQPGQFGHGLWLLAIGCFVALCSLLIRKKRKEGKR
jgi:hypothetical protein